MSKIYLYCSVLILSFGWLIANAQKVENIATRIEGKDIVITYDLSTENPHTLCEVKIYFGNSTAQTNLLINATGDLGADITNGRHKQVRVSYLSLFVPYQKDLTFRVEATFTHIPKLPAIN